MAKKVPKRELEKLGTDLYLSLETARRLVEQKEERIKKLQEEIIDLEKIIEFAEANYKNLACYDDGGEIDF